MERHDRMSCESANPSSRVFGGVSLADVLAHPRLVTPLYVYDLDAMAAEARSLIQAFDDESAVSSKANNLVAYAIKANAAGPIVRELVAEGCGADVVSGGELTLALDCGVPPERIVFSGVGKTNAEIDLATGAGASGIAAIQVESLEEIERVAIRARQMNRVARVSLRINPAVHIDDLATHEYIATGHDEAKFGVPIADVSAALDRIANLPSVRLVGVGAHVGSQLTAVEPYLAAARIVFGLAKEVRVRFASLQFVDTGGGFGIDYGSGCSVRPADFIRAVCSLKKDVGLHDLGLYCEPGRSLVGAHGVLVARVIQRKISGHRRWLMIDAGMNDLMRPALYQARHRIVSVRLDGAEENVRYRVVGPVCESSDDFGVHELPESLGTRDSDAVMVLDAGAYGYSMASRYNGRALPTEIFVRRGVIEAWIERQPNDAWVRDRLSASPFGA